MDYNSSPPFSSLSDSNFSQSPELQSQTTLSPPRRPPLAAPRLFRDIFSADGSGPSSRNTPYNPPINYQETLQDVRSAIQSADMAVRNAQEAFRSGRTSSGRHTVVDLTNSPPNNNADDAFMSRTVHPHDPVTRPSSIRMNTNFMHEPVYGAHTSPLFPAPPPVPHQLEAREMFNPMHLRRRFMEARLSQPGTVAAEEQRQEQAAIRRQQQARREWEGVQRLNAHRQQEQNRPSSQQNSSPIHEAQRDQTRHTSLPSTLSSPATHSPTMSEQEPVDLTDVNDDVSLNAALSRARQDAVAALKPTATAEEGGRSALTAYKCPICMESPQSATTTICGHVFCHRCIMDTLKWSEQQRREDGLPGRRVKGVCPVCRKPLNRKDEDNSGPTRSLVPLEIQFTTKAQFKKKHGGDDAGTLKRKARSQDASDVEWDKGAAGSNGKENRGSKKKQKQEALDDEALDDEALFGEWLED